MVVPTLRPSDAGSTSSSSACRMRSGQASTFTLWASTAPRSHPRANSPMGASLGAANSPRLTPSQHCIPARGWQKAAGPPQGDAHNNLQPPAQGARASEAPMNWLAFGKGTHRQGGGRTLLPQGAGAAMWVGLELITLQKKKRMVSGGLCSIVMLISEVLQIKHHF